LIHCVITIRKDVRDRMESSRQNVSFLRGLIAPQGRCRTDASSSGRRTKALRKRTWVRAFVWGGVEETEGDGRARAPPVVEGRGGDSFLFLSGSPAARRPVGEAPQGGALAETNVLSLSAQAWRNDLRRCAQYG